MIRVPTFKPRENLEQRLSRWRRRWTNRERRPTFETDTPYPLYRALQSRRSVFLLIVVAAEVSWLPAAITNGDSFWVGLSVSLFTSALTVLGTVFGIEALIEASRRRSSVYAAARAALIGDIDDILFDLWNMDKESFRSTIEDLRDNSDINRPPRLIAKAWRRRRPWIAAALASDELAALVFMAEQAAARAPCLVRHLHAARDAISEEAALALQDGITALEGLQHEADGARSRFGDTLEDSTAALELGQVGLRNLHRARDIPASRTQRALWVRRQRTEVFVSGGGAAFERDVETGEEFMTSDYLMLAQRLCEALDPICIAYNIIRPDYVDDSIRAGRFRDQRRLRFY